MNVVKLRSRVGRIIEHSFNGLTGAQVAEADVEGVELAGGGEGDLRLYPYLVIGSGRALVPGDAAGHLVRRTFARACYDLLGRVLRDKSSSWICTHGNLFVAFDFMSCSFALWLYP